MPDNASIELIYQRTSTPLPSDPEELDADLTPFGMKCYIPVIPPRGKYVRQAVDIVSSIRKQFNLNVKLSIFGDGRALITIHFRSDNPEQVRCAELCESSLWAAMTDAGFPPYRVGIDQMQRLIELQPAFFDIVAQLKTTFDPNSIISPGRYSPL
jgi:4-cresol dehydrogenase (hydroxylating)